MRPVFPHACEEHAHCVFPKNLCNGAKQIRNGRPQPAFRLTSLNDYPTAGIHSHMSAIRGNIGMARQGKFTRCGNPDGEPAGIREPVCKALNESFVRACSIKRTHINYFLTEYGTTLYKLGKILYFSTKPDGL